MTRLSLLQQRGYTIRPDTMRTGAVYVSKNGIHKWFVNISEASKSIKKEIK